MKKVIIGIGLALVGAIMVLPMLIQISEYSRTLGGWSTPPGKFLTILNDLSMIIPMGIASGILLLGVIILMIEYFKK